MSKSTRPSLQFLKLEAYEMYGVASTKQLKKLFGKGYDFRRRETWLEVLGKGQAANLAQLQPHEYGSNNIYPFERSLRSLFRRADEIIGDD